LYHHDTRHFSQFDLLLNGMRPLLLSSTLGPDNVMLTSDLYNASTADLGVAALDQGVLHVQRSVFLGDGTCHRRLAIHNFRSLHSRVRLELRFKADFADLFEVRGMRREHRGSGYRPCWQATKLPYRILGWTKWFAPHVWLLSRSPRR
jgi:glycogen debranching enzyme